MTTTRVPVVSPVSMSEVPGVGRSVCCQGVHRSLGLTRVAPPVEPLDDGVVPPLVLRARQMGLDV
jgi:hypothetical protein